MGISTHIKRVPARFRDVKNALHNKAWIKRTSEGAAREILFPNKTVTDYFTKNIISLT